MDIGRNDSCPCGSGKKYKRCCGAVIPSDPMATAAKAWRAAQDAAEPKVLRLAREAVDKQVMKSAWDDFALPHAGHDADGPESQLFLPWLIYDWLGDTVPLARRLLSAGGHRLDERERRFLETASTAPTSYHEVVGVEPGRSLRLRDVLLGTETTVFEQSGSRTLREGDLLFARVAVFEDVALMVGSGSILLPPIEKGILLDLRTSLRRSFRSLSADLLRSVEPQLRETYFIIRQRLLNPPLPVMSNTDGDPMEFHTLHYRIDDADAAFEALAPLSVGREPDELLTDAKRSRDGSIRQVSFDWSRLGNAKHGAMPSTILASITIDGTTLSVEVNSAKRAKAVKSTIKKRLGDQATFLREAIQSIDDAMANLDKPETAKERAARKRNEELQAQPEVQELIAKMNADHYATWPDIALPALRGKTPREAMKTSDGRERVEALLADVERRQGDGRITMPPYDFNLLRAALGLPRREPRTPRGTIVISDDVQ